MPHSRRFVVVPLLLSVAALGGCGASEEEKAAEALCEEFRWDPELSDEANADRVDEIRYRYEPTYYMRVVDVAEEKCPGVMDEYVAYQRDWGGPAETPEPVAEDTPLPEPDPVVEGDPELEEYLTGRGIDADLVRELGQVADVTGYGIDADTGLSFEQAQQFASVIVMTCDEVASGSLSWSASMAQDVADGASPGNARTMNNFLRDRFCPALN